jgi:S-adenosyl-L-methionine hydrolase (adenosine-forming)
LTTTLLSGYFRLPGEILSSLREVSLAHRPIITLTTDFGTNDHFVGVVKGVILDIAPEAEIVDICHSVQAFDVLDGALTISQAYSYFPTRTVHVVVVDPGVGTARRPILASSDKHHFVAPDNGVLSLVYAREERMHVRHITSEHYFLQPVSNTFHARDIFAPVAAYLAKEVDTLKFGEEIEDYVRFAAPKPKAVDANRLRGVILKVDKFGNLVTNITPQDAPFLFAADAKGFKIIVGSREITEIHNAYAEGAPGEVFGVLGSMGFLEIATNRGAAAQLTGAGKGTDVSVIRGEAAAAGKGA